jgi:hypothetical protein
MYAMLFHSGDIDLAGWLLMGLIYVALPLTLLVFLAFRIGDYLRIREKKRRNQPQSNGEPPP